MAEVVKKQADAGVDLINDGEMSKPSYATYIKDRLDGFGGTGNTFVYQDLADFPRLEKRVFGDPGRSRRKTPACNAPISVRDKQAPQIDADNLKAALAGVTSAGGFMSAASPGVVSLFFRNEHYKDFESYIYAIADAMRHEYETVAKAGFVLQIDCPDLAHGTAHPIRGSKPPRLSQTRAIAHRGAQSRGRQHPARTAAHASLLGQLRGPAPPRRPAC